MPIGKRIALAVGILVLGACAAAPFYRPDSKLPQGRKAAQRSQLVLRPQAASPPAVEPARLQIAPLAVQPGGEKKNPAEASQPSRLRAPVTIESAAPPALPRSYPATPVEHAPAIDRPARPELDATAVGDAKPIADSGVERPEFLLHRIVDGDTLAELAQRYLGDSSRVMEIFRANRGSLASTDVLPIGLVIRIPQNGVAGPEETVGESINAESAEENASTSDKVGPSGGSLVPIAPGALRQPQDASGRE